MTTIVVPIIVFANVYGREAKTMINRADNGQENNRCPHTGASLYVTHLADAKCVVLTISGIAEHREDEALLRAMFGR